MSLHLHLLPLLRSLIPTGIAEINEAPVDLHKERQKRRGLREQLSAGQVAGTFISAVQKQQVMINQRP